MSTNRMELARKSLPIFEKVNEYTDEGIVVPYDDYLIKYLSTHTNKDYKYDNYLDLLCSTRSMGNCYTYARYLALGMKGDYQLCEGNLSSLYDGYFPHAWVENDKYVYDVAFIGKWPKEVYYKLFNPIDVKIIDLENDKKFTKYKNNSIEAINKAECPFLKYIKWYGYMSNVLSGWPMDSPAFSVFPQDEEKMKAYKEAEEENEKEEMVLNAWNNAICNRNNNYKNHPLSDWKPSNTNNNDEIPSELLSKEFRDNGGEKILDELCVFISLNRETYETYKYDKSDISIWHKAVLGKYSGSLCLFTDEIPTILEQIEKNKKQNHTR